MANHAISEHDVVDFRGPVGDWPAGTRGTVTSVYDGKTLDTLKVPPTPPEIERR